MIILLLILALLGSLALLFRKRVSQQKLELSQFSGLVVGHRGCVCKSIPENSMFAFTKALESGLKGIEVDVRLTSDDRVVVFHDEFVERVLNGMGNCCDMTFQELQGLTFKENVSGLELVSDWQSFISDKLPNERVDRVPSFEQVILFAKKYGLKIIIDLKEVKRRELLYKKLVELFKKYDLYQDAFVGSFNPFDLYSFRKMCGDREEVPITTCLLYCKGLLQWYHDDKSEEMRLPWLINNLLTRYLMDEALTLFAPTFLATFLGVDMIGPDQRLLSQSLVQTAHQRGLAVYSWVCNEDSQKEYYSKLGVMVCTDQHSNSSSSQIGTSFTTSQFSEETKE